MKRGTRAQHVCALIRAGDTVRKPGQGTRSVKPCILRRLLESAQEKLEDQFGCLVRRPFGRCRTPAANCFWLLAHVTGFSICKHTSHAIEHPLAHIVSEPHFPDPAERVCSFLALDSARLFGQQFHVILKLHDQGLTVEAVCENFLVLNGRRCRSRR